MDDQTQSEQKPGRRLRDHLLRGFRNFLSADPREEGRLEAHALIEDALRARASDVHIDPEQGGCRIRLRIDGLMADALEIDRESGALVVNQVKALAGIDPVPALHAASGSFSLPVDGMDIDLRVTVVRCVPGEKLAMRILAPPQLIQSIVELGVPPAEAPIVRGWAETAGGALLVAGPTGSGKTTTLYALLHEVRRRDIQVVTLEDPVEHLIPGINQIQVDEKHGLGFDSGTVALLRLDPDYVLVGEIRDGVSARAAINVATSGRSLLATLHSRDAVGSVTSLRNMGLHDFEIAPNLDVVIAQRLVRRLCPECSERVPLDEVDRRWLQQCGRTPPTHTCAPRGCGACNDLGFKGRIGVFEVWQLTAGDRAGILGHQDESSMRRDLAHRGQRLMIDDGVSKVEQGLTTYRELVRAGILFPQGGTGP
jgi:general secretion pathway protein E